VQNNKKINTFFLPHLSDTFPATRFRTAFTMPKLAIKDKISVLDSMWNMSLPINGTTVCSRPTIAPTNAFTNTRIKNWLMFGLRPNLMVFESSLLFFPPGLSLTNQ